MHSVAAHCFFMGREACSSVATLDLYSLLLVENSSPYTRAVERYSAEHCRQGNPAPLPVWREGEGKLGQAGVSLLWWDGGGVQACNQTHCLYDQLPRRQIQGTVKLNYRHTDSVLFGNETCCTIKRFSTSTKIRVWLHMAKAGLFIKFVHWEHLVRAEK